MNKLRGLYLHVPFCSVKCFYCDFTAFAGQKAKVRRYVTALCREALKEPILPTDTLYVGGGTPTELSAEEFREIFGTLGSARRPAGGWIESTVEASPESLTLDHLRCFSEAGIGRLSLGLQTFEPRLLKAIGRRHTVENFLEAYTKARDFGFSLNVDLMTGLPSQTLEDVARSLDTLISLDPDHVSLYGLSVEDRTLFSKREVEVDEELDRSMYELALGRLSEAGYRHYEISNFAKPGKESVHNRIYWADGEYVGLGCGASGQIGGVRYANKDRLADYCEAVESGASPRAEEDRLSGKEKLGETVLLGLRRLEGIDLTPEMEAFFSREFEKVESAGWVERRDRRVRLTREGLFLANRVFEEFVAPFQLEEDRIQ